ncbi:MAG: hypothetical protein ACRDJ2_16790, partial [Actinomycetota bacterium]
MFLSHRVEIDKPFEAVEQALSQNPLEWVSSVMGPGDEPGEVRLIVGNVGSPLSKTARLQVGALHSRIGGATLPLRLEATGPSALFPRLDADLDITPLNDRHTQLTLRGSYAPPLGKFGEVADRIILHRVAEITIQGLVHQI